MRAMDAVPQEGHFDYRDVRYRYIAWGTAVERAPLILVHGFAQSAHSWERVAPLLTQHRRVYAFELVGHGGSQVPLSPLPYVLDAQGEALLAFMESVTRCASAKSGGMYSIARAGAGSVVPKVVGYSMGGRVALAAAHYNPQAFGALVLESAGLGPATSGERSAFAKRDAANALSLREAGIEAFMNRWELLPLFATQRSLPQDVRARVRAGRLANDAEALARTFEHAGQHGMPARSATLETLKELTKNGVPVLYLAGAQDEKYRALAEELSATLIQTQVVQRAGHNIHLEAPDAFVAALLSGKILSSITN